MPSTSWWPNAASVAQVDTLSVTAVATGGTLSVTIGGQTLTYTCVVSDTTTTAAAALSAALQAFALNNPIFNDATYATSTNTVTLTASTPGTPFGPVTVSSGGGATLAIAHTTANKSPSDVFDANNWLRNGVASLPVGGDDLVISDSSVPLLWNLDKLANTAFNSVTRYQNFTAQVGLPEVNAAGYQEYRPTYLKLSGNSGAQLVLTLGVGPGSGPSLERYDAQTSPATLNALAAGGAAQAYNVYFLGSSLSNIVNVGSALSVAVAMNPGETAQLSTATVNNGGQLFLGTGCTFGGTLTVTNSAATLNCVVPTVSAIASQITVQANGGTYASMTGTNGTTFTWLSNANWTNLVLTSGSTLDKSQDQRAITGTNTTIDGDTCQILDPASCIAYTTAIVVKNATASGPLQFGPNRTVKIT